jgi:hypothetical protein
MMAIKQYALIVDVRVSLRAVSQEPWVSCLLSLPAKHQDAFSRNQGIEVLFMGGMAQTVLREI